MISLSNLNPFKKPIHFPKINVDTHTILFIFGIIGLFGIFIYHYCSRSCSTFAELFLISIASMIFGAMGGFLFGLPKMGKINPDGKVKANTNLEEISDWLTKIIVGIGLTQLSEIKALVSDLMDSIHQDIPTLPKSIIFLLFTYFIIYGFFFSYLSTRIYLGEVFALSDEKAANAQSKVDKALGYITTGQIIQG